jgi:hypothetical protein
MMNIHAAGLGVLCFFSFFGCSSASALDQIPSTDTCLALVAAHVASTRGWTDGEYTVKKESTGEGMRGYEVMYLKDMESATPASLKSFHVDLDVDCGRVIRELGCQ